MGRKALTLNSLEVSSAWSRAQQWFPASVSASLQSEAAISYQSTDPQFWRTGSLLPTLVPQVLCKVLKECVHYCLLWGYIVAVTIIRAEINPSQLFEPSPRSCKPLIDSRVPKSYSRQILQVHLLSRWGDGLLGASYSILSLALPLINYKC